MSWSLVQKSAAVATGSVSSGASVTPALPAASTAGNLLVAIITTLHEPDTVSGPAGWVQAAQGIQSSPGSASLWYYLNNPGGITSAVFTDSAGQSNGGYLAEFTAPGVASATLDQPGTGTASSATSCTLTATASSAAGDLAVGGWFENKTSPTYTPPSGWTSLGSGNGITGSQFAACLLSAAAGTLSASASSSASSGSWCGALATFTASSTVSGAGSIAGAGSVSAPAALDSPASLAGAGSVSAAAAGDVTAAVAGTGAVSAPVTLEPAAGLHGAGIVSAAGIAGGAAGLAGAGSLGASAVQEPKASLAGAGSVTATAVQDPRASLAGAGAVSAAAASYASGTAAIAGAGSLSAPAGLDAPASPAGAGAVTAAASLTEQELASASGSGTLTAAGTAVAPATFVIAVAVGDSALAGTSMAPAGWTRLATVTAGNGTDHTGDTVLAAACATLTAPSASVTATSSVHEDMAGQILGVICGAPSPVPPAQNPYWPYLLFEAAFGSGYMTPPDQMAWTNLQSAANGKRLRSWSETEGEQYELSALEAGELQLVLDNPDAALSPFNPSSPWFPYVMPGTPIRIRAVPPATTGYQGWQVIQRNMERWPQEWDACKRGLVNGQGTDIWSVIARPLPACYRAEVLADEPGWWWPCDDPAVIPLPGSLVNAAPGSTSRLQIVTSPNGLSETITGYPFASGFAYSAVQEYAANQGWMYGDPLSASWQQSGTGTVTAGRYLACQDSYPPLAGGVTIEGWWQLPFHDTGAAGAQGTGPYTQPSGQVILWEITSATAPLAALSLNAGGDLQITTWTGSTPSSTTLVAADCRNTTWTGVTVTLTQDSWQAWVNGTLVGSGTAPMASAWSWFLGGAGTGNSGAPPTAGTITGIGNVAHSHVAIYPRVLPSARIMAHFMAAYTGFGQMPAPAISAQFIQNSHAAGAGSQYGPDGGVYSGSAFTPPAAGSPNNTLAAVACMTGGGYTSAPSIPETVQIVGSGLSVNGFMWLTAASPACPAITWYTGDGAGTEQEAAVTEAAYLYVDGYGSGAVPPSAPSALGDTVQQRIERILAAGLVTTPARAIDPASSPCVAELDTGGQACGMAVTNIIQSDGGLLIVDNNDVLCYLDKPHLAAQQVAWQVGEDTASGLIPYQEGAGFDTDPQQVKNDIAVTQYNASPDVSAPAGGLASGSGEAASGLTFAPDGSRYAAIQASIAQNGPGSVAFTSYLQSGSSIQAQCDWLFDQFGEPRQRITSMTVNAAALGRTAPQAWLFVLGVNPGDVIQATRTPPGQPSFTGTWRIGQISRRLIDFKAGTASVTFSADYYTADMWE